METILINFLPALPLSPSTPILGQFLWNLPLFQAPLIPVQSSLRRQTQSWQAMPRHGSHLHLAQLRR